MSLWAKRIALAALVACSAGAGARRERSSHVVIYDETQAEPEEPAPATAPPKPDPGAEARKRLEQARAAALRRIEQERAARDLARFTSPRLTRFADDTEFARYAGAVEKAARLAAADRHGIRFAQAQPQPGTATDISEPVCPPEDLDCLNKPDTDEIVVTGSAMAPPRNPSITNNQLAGIEEGDIVKQIDHYLLVLQDGRIFVADTRAGGGRGLALVNRVNVYRDPESDTWYDEMLVIGDRVVVTGYSYEDRASEIAVFRLARGGGLTSEGVFHMSSNDYYSSSNYATRLVGDRLIVYSLFGVSDMDTDQQDWPVVRRWLSGEDRDAARERGTPRFGARDVYRPVRATVEPTVHAVSVCPLGQVDARRDLGCRTTAFVGESYAEWYVDGTDTYIWSWRRYQGGGGDWTECPAGRPSLRRSTPALLHRVPHDGTALTVAGTRGLPNDQFSFQLVGSQLQALLRLEAVGCYTGRLAASHLAYLSLPLRHLGPTLRDADVPYVALPSTGTYTVANRFTEHYLVYGGLSGDRSGLPVVDWDEVDPDYLPYMRRRFATPPAFVVPVERPGTVTRLPIRQTVIRAERVGPTDILLSGYPDREGIQLTYIDLSGRPRIASKLQMSGRFESEGRSHAFNSLVGADGSGIMGLPTTPTQADSNRWWWRSRASDLSYIRLDRGGAMKRLGELGRRATFSEDGEVVTPGYKCEVSCIDWYGNSRPIFTEGRVFALSGTELIEGRIGGGRITEIARLDLTAPPPRQASAR